VLVAADTRQRDDRVARAWYSVFGMPVLSEIPLPMAPIRVDAAAQPVWTFERAKPEKMPPPPEGEMVSETACFAPCHNGQVISRVHRGDNGSWLWHAGLATFWISPDARRVVVYAIANADESLLRMFLIGQIATLLLQQRGYPSLHSSAIQTQHGAVVFLGRRGQGKSTMAASFLKHGYTLITDDALPLRVQDGRVCGGPGISIMKLWAATAENTLRLNEQLPTFLQNYDKKLLTLDGRYSLADQPSPIRAVYVLDRRDPPASTPPEIALDRVSAREGHAALMAQTSWGELLLPAERAKLIPLYVRLVTQAPVRLLRYPTGFEFQEEVRARILADLEQP
jgi:hypothetical protein